MAQKTLNFSDMEDGAENESDGNVDAMLPRDASALIREAGAEELLRFWDGMRISREKIERDMQRYNESVANDVFIVPYGSIEEFIVDPGVRAKIAMIYNDKRSRRRASYVEAANAIVLVPNKPRKRSMVDALRARIAHDAGETLPPDDWKQPKNPR